MSGAGNRCGHDPAQPRWFLPPPRHQDRPRILLKLAEQVRRYYHAPVTLPSLNLANGSERQQRSERREACVNLLACLLHYTDLVTLRVGIPQADGSFRGLTMAFLATASGLGLRRAERAIRDLAAAGILSIHPIAQRLDDQTYHGLAAIRAVSRALFDAFGLGQWLRHERDKAAARRRKKERKADPRGLAHVALALNRRHPDSTSSHTAAETRSNSPTAVSAILANIKANLKGAGPPS